jgi:hypothetical protein
MAATLFFRLLQLLEAAAAGKDQLAVAQQMA